MDATSIWVNHKGGGPAFNVFNQLPGTTPVGNGVCFSISDYSTHQTMLIARTSAPAPTGTPVIDVVSSAGSTTTFGILRAATQDRAQALYLRNDGAAAFGLPLATSGPVASLLGGSPVRVQIDLNYLGTAGNLVLSNPNAATTAGASITFLGPGHVETAQLATSNDDAQNTSVAIKVRSRGTIATPVKITGANVMLAGKISFGSSEHESVGSKPAALGSNSPAIAPGEPYVWVRVTTSDGSEGFIPIWK